MQFDIGNYVVLFVSLGFILTCPAQHLQPVQPPSRLTSLAVLAPIALYMGFYAVEQGFAVVILSQQSWYHPETSKV